MSLVACPVPRQPRLILAMIGPSLLLSSSLPRHVVAHPPSLIFIREDGGCRVEVCQRPASIAGPRLCSAEPAGIGGQAYCSNHPKEPASHRTMISLKLPLSRTASRASLGKDDWEDVERPQSRASTPPKSLTSSSASSIISAGTGGEAGVASSSIQLTHGSSLLFIKEDATINVQKTLEDQKGKQHSIECV